MAIPKRLCIYGLNSMLFDEFKRNPREYGLGVNIYPSGTRSRRINVQGVYVDKCAAGGTSGCILQGRQVLQ